MNSSVVVVYARVHRLRASVVNCRPLNYPEIGRDVDAALTLLEHYQKDAETLREEKELIWCKVNTPDRAARALRIAEWSTVIVVWAAVLAVWYQIVWGR